MIDENEYIKLGEIYREHGVKGFCKFYSYSTRGDNLVAGQSYVLESLKGQSVEVTIEKISALNQFYLVRFNIFKVPEEIIPYRKAVLWQNKNLLQKSHHEIYDYEYVGFSVYTASQNEKIGDVVDVIYNPLKQFVVARVQKNSSQTQEVMIPAVEEWVVELDLKNKKIVLELPEGLW